MAPKQSSSAASTAEPGFGYALSEKTSQTDDQRIKEVTPLPPPEHLIRFFPIAGTPVETLIGDTRRAVRQIMNGADDRLLAMMAVLVRGLGVDRISDMVCNIWKARFITYTQAICAELSVPIGDVIAEPLDVHESLSRAEREARVSQMLGQVPAGLRSPAEHILPYLVKGGPQSPGYFDVLVNSLNIMQERITRSRLAGEPPHVIIAPEVASINLLEFDRAKETIAAGRAAVERTIGAIRDMLSC